MARFSTTVLLLIAFGFFKEMKPSEPFLTPYLVDDKGISNDDLDNEVYPVWTYAYLGALAVVLLITDRLNYSPIILLEALSCLVTRSLLIWTGTVTSMQVMQTTYGINSASEIAYYTSIYRITRKEEFLQLTSYFRASVLAGQTVAGILAQLLVSVANVSYLDLNYISFASVCVAVCLGLVLALPLGFDIQYAARPTAPHLVFQESSRSSEDRIAAGKDADAADDEPLLEIAAGTSQLSSEQGSGNNCSQEPSSSSSISRSGPLADETRTPVTVTQSISDFVRPLWQTFKACYRNVAIRRWCLWWILATCGDFQVENYMSTLWEEISPAQGNSDVYNGGVTACATCAGIVAAIIIGRMQVKWTRYGEVVLAFLSFIDCAALFLASQTNSIWMAYGMYVLFAIIYTLLITIISAEVAKSMHDENYAFVFGFHMFFALLLQTMLTLVVNNEQLNIDIRPQFVIYSAYFGLIGLIFLVATCYCRRRRPNSTSSVI